MNKKTFLKKILSFLGGVIIAIEMVAIAFLLIVKISGGVPSFFGYNMYVIVSPSMSPVLEVGDVIISKEYTEGQLSVGDTVQYVGKYGDAKGKIITHQIIGVSGEGSDAVVITKGVANAEPDPPIHASDVIAVMQYKTHVIDKIYRAISTTAGFICLVLLPMMAMIVYEIVDLAKELHKEKEEKGGKENDKT